MTESRRYATTQLAEKPRWDKLLIVICILSAVCMFVVAPLLADEKTSSVGAQAVIMPGESFLGPLPPLTEEQTALRDALRLDVNKLAGEIGDRNIDRPEQYAEAAQFIEQSLRAAGYTVGQQTFRVKGYDCRNLEVEIRGTTHPDEIVIVGAHYDSVAGCPAANDNGSGVAGLLALARDFAGKKTDRTLRFVAFANEEPPYFQTEAMGSLVYARRCKKKREKLVAMLSLETIGYYSDENDSQKYPPVVGRFFPSTGNFIGFVGNLSSRKLVQQVIGSFRKHAKFPSEGAAMPAWIEGVGWSDHWSFWQVGYPALMVTDTAPFRYQHYHAKTDTPDKIVYDRMARVVAGLEKVIADLATPEPSR